MKSLYLIIVLLIFYSSGLYAQFEDDPISYPRLMEEQFILESPHRFIDPEELDSLITLTMETYHIPGLSALIVEHDSIVWSNNYGYRNVALNLPVEDSTFFMMASISKTIMVTAIMQLWEQGLFELEDNINDYLLPDFQVVNPNFPADSITIKMLMTHTSSIDDNWNILIPLISCDDSQISLDSFFVNYFTPGGIYYTSNSFLGYSPSSNIWHYTNVGSALLAFIVEKLSGIPFPQYCRENIFDLLEMNETSWFLTGMDTTKIAVLYEWIGNQYYANCHQGWPVYPAAYLKTNKIELEHFLSAYMNGGTYNGNEILESATIDTMLQVYKYVDPYNSWGLIWYQILLGNRYLWGHTGGWSYGTNTSMFFHPEEDWGYIVFMNMDVDNNAFWYINEILGDYAHNFGEIYAVNTTLNETYIRPVIDTLTIRTEFSNFNQHDFTANSIYVSSDSSLIDSVALYDDGMHGDSLAGDGIWGGFIHSISDEEIFSICISTVDMQTGKYFYADAMKSFTTSGPVDIYSLGVTYNSFFKTYSITPYIRNAGQNYTVEDLKVFMTSEDSAITQISGVIQIPSLSPGDTVAQSSYTVRVDTSIFSGEFLFNFEIKSGDWSYWKDTVSYIVTGVENEMTLPEEFSLSQNYPNPFNPSTTIKYAIPERAFVELKVYDILGSEVVSLINEEQDVGYYEIDFNAAKLSSGVYLYQLKAGEFIETKKMLLLK